MAIMHLKSGIEGMLDDVLDQLDHSAADIPEELSFEHLNKLIESWSDEDDFEPPIDSSRRKGITRWH